MHGKLWKSTGQNDGVQARCLLLLLLMLLSYSTIVAALHPSEKQTGGKKGGRAEEHISFSTCIVFTSHGYYLSDLQAFGLLSTSFCQSDAALGSCAS